MRSGYRRLAAYEKAARLGDDLHGVVHTWRPLDQRTLGTQLLNAVDSIGANIAEGAGRFTERDRRRFFIIARGSLLETEHWLARAEARGLLPQEYSGRLDDIARPLAGLINKPGPKK
jgi:four helix bundle protein